VAATSRFIAINVTTIESIHDLSEKCKCFFHFFYIFLYLIPYNFLLNLGLYVETKKNQLVVKRRSHRYASFLRLAAEEIILRQYSRNLIFAVLVALLYRNITE